MSILSSCKSNQRKKTWMRNSVFTHLSTSAFRKRPKGFLGSSGWFLINSNHLTAATSPNHLKQTTKKRPEHLFQFNVIMMCQLFPLTWNCVSSTVKWDQSSSANASCPEMTRFALKRWMNCSVSCHVPSFSLSCLKHAKHKTFQNDELLYMQSTGWQNSKILFKSHLIYITFGYPQMLYY